MLRDDVSSNQSIGFNGSSYIIDKFKHLNKFSILTHSHTGSLSTNGAFGVIRSLHDRGVLEMLYCTETPPLYEGLKLMSMEVADAKIPATLIVDSTVGALMRGKRVNLVIVGADRVTANGDISNNKIGSNTLATCAHANKVPFYVAASLSSFDTVEEIISEVRPSEEKLKSVDGLSELAEAPEISVWNPAFDVTPAAFIDGIITEKGVITKYKGAFDLKYFIEQTSCNTIQSVLYRPGELKLLDQRKLPSATVYVDFEDFTNGCQKIFDMVLVRDAPAIPIFAALSLAVEVEKMKESFQGTSEYAASHIISELKNFVGSLPRELSQSNAAAFNKLEEIVAKAVPNKNVFQSYLEAAEGILKKDVASNRAIGSNGANFLRHHHKNINRFSVLTHGPSGSLVTAGYGTALGVIRALHTAGLLEMAYCTKMQPLDEGSNLTAFELNYEKIPVALTIYPAVSYLMKRGLVNVIIVGADSIAVNGDTVNKIGTYGLALLAQTFKIPFYVAAPLSSINFSLPKQDTVEGGAAEQVMESGIRVWKGDFDITNADLIEGIITEKGVIEKSNGAFDIRSFIKYDIGSFIKYGSIGSKRKFSN